MKMYLICGLALVLFLFCVSAFGQSVVQPSVSVVGNADIEVAPNQVSFTFEVVTTDAAISEAKRQNDVAAGKTIAVAKTFSIANDDLQTDRLTIAPRYAGERDPRGKGAVIGYEVTKRIVVTFKQLDRIDEFLAKVIDAGVNRIVDISIENSELEKYEQQVRLLAIENARQKAEAYAKRLGQRVGRAYVIREETADTPGYTTGSGIGYGNGIGDGDSERQTDLSVPNAYASTVTFALGKISVSDKIYVTFELLSK